MAKTPTAARDKPRRPSTIRSYQETVRAILLRREALMGELLALRRQTRPAHHSPIAKTEALLTRFWGAADWNSRAELLRTAQWLLDIAKAETALKNSAERNRKSPRRKGTVARPSKRTRETTAHVADD